MPNDKRVFDYQLDMLKEELSHISGAIRQHDEITKSIKNWAIITWIAAVGIALKESQLQRFIGLTAIIPLVFWIVDASFRRIQRSFITRTQQIAHFVNSDEFVAAAKEGKSIKFKLLLIRHRSREFKNTLLGTMLFRTVAFLYVGLAICSLIIWQILRTTVTTSVSIGS